MKPFTILYAALACILVVLMPGVSRASTEPYAAKPLKGSQVRKDSSCVVIDTVYFNPSLKPLQTTFSVQNLVSFKINEFTNTKLPDKFKVTISFQVYFTRDVNGTAVLDSAGSTPRSIQIDYDKDSYYSHKAVCAFKGGHRAEVKITNVVVNTGTLADFESALMVENELVVKREYQFSCTNNAVTALNPPVYSSARGELAVSWNSQRAADEYDLEWTWIDDSAIANYYQSGTTNVYPNMVFTRNATRVSIAKTDYLIPLLYDGGGHLFYRVRAVQVKANGQRIESVWSTDYPTTGLGDYPFTGHENGLNWQVSTSFAEDGKRKSVVQYFDGSLRNRQTVTKDNTTDTTIVAETFYDYQGRPAIQVLPSPSLNSRIQYTPNYNSALNGVEYDKIRYDGLLSDSCYCRQGAERMDSASGTAQYYSSNNPLTTTGFHKYIPNAKGFVFSETRYTPDNTDRVSLQSGVGVEFQIDSGRATRYFYSRADQEELDALFGTEAGNSSHYFKNMVRDANGQYSISYVDMHGRTIATALAGTPVTKMDLLNSNQPYSITKKLLDSTTNIIKGTSIESSRGLIVTKAGSHRFKYSLLPDSISIKACDSANICYDCSYDLEITITDECNNSTLPGGVPFVITKSNLTIDTTCNTPVSFPGVDSAVYLREGNYLVTKRLTISKKAMDDYRDVFLRRNTCKTLDQFIAEQKALLNLECEPSCASCMASLGDWTSFRPGYMTRMGIPNEDTAAWRATAWQAFNQQVQDCDELCNGKTMDRSIRDQMLSDVTAPNGQYVNAANAGDMYSISYTGEPEPETLLTQHPEYSKLVRYEQLKDSHAWDLRFENTETFKAAVDSGYLNPANFSGLPANATFQYVSQRADPLFTSLAPGKKADMQIALQQSAEKSAGVYISAWSLATIMAHCPDGDAACLDAYASTSTAFTMDTACSGEQDIAWRYFREIYLKEKRRIVDSLLSDAATLAGKDPVYYQGLSQAPGHILNFVITDMIQAAGDIPATENQAKDSLNSFIADNCKAYAIQWWRELKPCNFSLGDSTAIVDRLIQVCKEGGDAEHLFGASTVKPSSTNLDRSFEQVLKTYAGGNYNSTCNVYLLSAPLPYDNQPIYYNKPVYQKPDSCECATISNLYDQYRAAGADTSFSAYIYRTTGTSISSGVLDTLRKACRGEINCSFLKEPITLPPVLQCGGQSACATCVDVDALNIQFKQEFPGVIPARDGSDSLQRVKNVLFERYMNSHLGFGKTTGEYLDFISNCAPSTCSTLQTVLGNYKRYGGIPHLDASGADTSNWRVNFGGGNYTVGVPLGEVIKNGVMKLPDYYADTLPDVSPYKRVDFDRYDSICLPAAGFNFESRIKIPDSLVIPNFFNDALWLILNSNPATSGSVLVSLKLTADKGLAICTHEGDPNKVCIEENVAHVPLNDWHILKLQFRGTQLKVYLDTTLMGQRTLDAPMTLIRDFSHTMYSQKGQVDYVRISDTSGKYVYREEFTDARNLAIPDSTTDCNGCQASFTQYYNQVQGTSLTYTQIASLYTTCGITLDPCQDTLSSQLTSVKDGFTNNFYNHGRKYDNNGCDINTWRVNHGGTFANTTGISHAQIFNNGVMQYPGLLYGGQGVDYDFFKIDSACIERHMSVEFRVKMPYYSQAAFQGVTYSLWFGVGPNSPSQKYYLSIGKNLNSNRASYIDYGTVENNRTYADITELQQLDFSDWRVLKLQIVDSVLKYYLDGQLVKTLNFPAGIALEKFYGLTVSAGADAQLSASIDWIKAYDKNNKQFYFEDFNSCSNFNVFDPFIHCPQAPCTQAFTAYYNGQKKTNYTYAQLDSLYKAHGLTLDVCSQADPSPTLCGRAEPVFAPVTLQRHTPCSDSTLFAVSKGTLLYDAYRDSLTSSFDNRYLAKCLNARYNETFTVEQPISEYHYTLYYYDQAGNLVQTVPPQGVDVSKFSWAAAWSDSVTIARRNKQMLRPKHSLPTTYVYNTLNQVVTQQSPDGGLTHFWYDRLGRLVISRNARQQAVSGTEQDRQYSYTQYDDLGRITEVGQVKNTSDNGAMTESISRNKDLLDNWLWNLTNRREQITQTIYDLPYPGFAGIAPKVEVVQRNLRNRVSYTSYTEGGNPSAYNNASFYTYDILGNVDTLLQDYGNASLGLASVYNIMNKNKNGAKKFTYQYDLISGKVNLAMYQLGWSDQWLHRYSYDAENRLVLVETSTDSLVWEKDARYEYYRHGPLARTVIGDQSVQGIDYAYTLQGWLKGVNSTGGTITHDIGGDGKTGALNQYTGRDAYGFNLNYFKGEYKAINAGVQPFPDHTPGLPGTDYRPLYNGNISSMAVYISRFETPYNTNGLLYNYQYDQLNRLKRQDTYTGFNRTNNAYQSVTFDSSFHEEVGYDANGNILNYRRNAQGGYNSFMDKLGYKYYPGTNQLRQVIDTVDANKYGTNGYEVIMDIDNQADTSNYVYDAIGNLIQDKAEGITNIKWNVYGKITEINRTASAKVPFAKIVYAYDAQGNRISKITTQNTGAMGYTWYVRDAQGNLITTYFTNDPTGANKDSLHLLGLGFGEQQIYGNSRLGMKGNIGNSIGNGPLDLQYFGYNGGNFYRGLLQYELTNHLGNVLTTISDKKLGVSSGGVGAAIDYYEPDIISANDYYPFGMLSRVALSTTSNHYRYGFNGKENDWEAKGWQNQQDYGKRIYDPRLGRFLSVDPITKNYPWYTPYQFAGNKPIWAVDLDGLEEWYFNNGGPVNYGWVKSNLFGGPWTEEKANALGYYSAQQVHNFQSDQSSHEAYAERKQRKADIEASVKGVERSQNLFVTAYEFSPIEGSIQAYKAYDEGHMAMAAFLGVTSWGDFGPLFRAAGREYAGIARSFAGRYTIEQTWKLNPAVRGILTEARLSTEYVAKGFEWLAETSQFFRKFDFYSAKDGIAVSLKTVNATKTFDFKNILKNIDELAALKAAGVSAQFGKEFKIKGVRLDIAVPKGYDQKLLEKVKEAAKANKIPINIFEH